MNISIALAILTILIGVLMLWDEFAKTQTRAPSEPQLEQAADNMKSQKTQNQSDEATASSDGN